MKCYTCNSDGSCSNGCSKFGTPWRDSKVVEHLKKQVRLGLYLLLAAVLLFPSCSTYHGYRGTGSSTSAPSHQSLSRQFNRNNNVDLKDRTKVDRLFRDLGRATRDRQVDRIQRQLKTYTR